MSPGILLNDQHETCTSLPSDNEPSLTHLSGRTSQAAANALRWTGSSFAENEKLFITVLCEDDINEIETAVASFEALNLPVPLVSQSNFPLPRLGKKLLDLKQTLYYGRGFFVLRGLQPRKYTGERNMLIYAGISTYIGGKRAVQIEGGAAIAHILDLSSKEDLISNENRYVGLGNRNVALPFHADDGHVLCLYSIHSATRGGRSRLASSQAVFDRLKTERPDLIPVLEQEWEWDSHDDKHPSFMVPLLFQENGKITLKYGRSKLLGSPAHPRNPALTPLSEEQIEALEVLERIASKVCLTFRFETGDIQYFNNLALLHAREAFIHEESSGCRRHLLRMFLQDSDRKEDVPTPLKDLMRQLYDHESSLEKFEWSLEPLPYVLSPD